MSEFVIGPICEPWYEEEVPGGSDLGCHHATCAAIAYMEPPPHDCPIDAFLDDPITVAYGVGSEMVHLIRCDVCDAIARDQAERSWEDATHRHNR